MDPLDQHMDTPIFDELRTKDMPDVKYGRGSVYAPKSGPIELPTFGYDDLVKAYMPPNPLLTAINPLYPPEMQMPAFTHDPETGIPVKQKRYEPADLPSDDLFRDAGTFDQPAPWVRVHTQEPAKALQVIDGGRVPEYFHTPAAPMSLAMKIWLALSVLTIVLCGIAFVVGAIASHR